MNDWNIQSRSRACQACHKAFVDKEAYYTLLFDQKHALERFDVCETCWKNQYGLGANDRKGFVSFWQGLFTAPAPPPPDPILKETAESLLRRLLELKDPQYGAACFILGAMLERKRLLKAKAKTTGDGQELTVYEHAKTGEMFAIPNPHLQLTQLEAVQHQVAHLLQHGLNAPAPPPAAPAEPASPAETAPSADGSGNAPSPTNEAPASESTSTGPNREADPAAAPGTPALSSTSES
jgi:hypothetical protein